MSERCIKEVRVDSEKREDEAAVRRFRWMRSIDSVMMADMAVDGRAGWCDATARVGGGGKSGSGENERVEDAGETGRVG